MYQRIRILPRLMRDVSHIDITCRLMGAPPALRKPSVRTVMAHSGQLTPIQSDHRLICFLYSLTTCSVALPSCLRALTRVPIVDSCRRFQASSAVSHLSPCLCARPI